MKSEKLIYIFAGAVFMVGVLLAGFFGNGFSPKKPIKQLSLPPRNYTIPELPLLNDYGTKIVYTTDTVVDKTPYQNDCSARGGVFNTCGNTCKPTAQTCSTICALTCSSE